MSRMSTGDQILVKPTNNVYTVLTAVAIIAQILAFIVAWQQAAKLFGAGTSLLPG